MASNALIDANVIVARFNVEDSTHAQSLQRDELNSSFALLDIVVYEIVTVLVGRCDFKTAVRFIEYIEDNDRVTILATSQYRKEYLRLFTELGSSKLSLVDIALMYHSANYTVVTFDKELQKAIDKRKRKK
jgi:predicted nucleic acid-binding protein